MAQFGDKPDPLIDALLRGDVVQPMLVSDHVRIAEIIQENHGGDVSAKDIDWLCGVATAAIISMP